LNKYKKSIVLLFLIFPLIFNFIGSSYITLNAYDDNKKQDSQIIDRTNTLETAFFLKGALPPQIEIDDGGSKNSNALRWSEARALGICTGFGTELEPYIIKTLTVSDVDGEGGCLYIRDSSAFFEIQNCIFLNSIDFGIKIYNSGNGTIINNQFSNLGNGISIDTVKNLTIDGNIINDNEIGLYISSSCYNITALNNIMNSCGLIMSYSASKPQMDSFHIDKTNKVNGKSLYYYINKKTLNKNDFNDAGQVILNNCNDTIISNLNVSKASRGISLHYSCNNVTISNITSSYENDYGFYVANCNNITIYNCTASFNKETGINLYGEKCNISKNILNYNKYSGISISSNNATIDNNVIKYNGYIGIELSYCGNVTFKNNNIVIGGLLIYGDESQIGSHFIDTTNTINGRILYYYSKKSYLENSDFSNAGQIILATCVNSTISNCNFSNVYIGIALYYCENVTTFNCNLSNNIAYGLYVENAFKCNFTNNVANNVNGTGFYFTSFCCFNVIFYNIANNNSYDGISISYDCTHNKISKNTINNNGYNGLALDQDCNYNNITTNEANYNGKNIPSDCGIYIKSCEKNNISDNNVNFNYDNGIYIELGANNTISNNTLKENQNYGIYLKKGIGNNVTKNIMVECGLGMYKLGVTIEEMTKNFINSDNRVNSKPLCYETHKVGLLASTFSNKGQIILINCSYSTISNVNVSRASTGITLYYCDNNTINRVNATFNVLYGLELYMSSKNNITENLFVNNSEYGIIIANYQSQENQIFANFFINNTFNAEDNGLNNFWNNATIGNYWDDYIGCDSDNDGIGETPYNVPGNTEAKDYKPITTRKCTPIILKEDDNKKKEEEPPIIIPFGNYYLVFMIVAIIALFVFIKKRKTNY